jgi:hypothetical protein
MIHIYRKIKKIVLKNKNKNLFCIDGLPCPYKDKTMGKDWFAYVKDSSFLIDC